VSSTILAVDISRHVEWNSQADGKKGNENVIKSLRLLFLQMEQSCLVEINFKPQSELRRLERINALHCFGPGRRQTD
jgi:hypothetical protein